MKSSIDAILRRLAENIGVRKRKEFARERHEIRTEYGFRIRWNTIMKNHEPPLNDNKIERMFSHHSNRLPLDSAYNKPEDHILHQEFAKAVLALTIDPTERQKIELEKKELEITELQQNQVEIQGLKNKQETLEKEMTRYKALIKFTTVVEMKRLGKGKLSNEWKKRLNNEQKGAHLELINLSLGDAEFLKSIQCEEEELAKLKKEIESGQHYK